MSQEKDPGVASHALGSAKSVREWTHSHVGSWSPKWTPEFSEHNCRGQNPSPWGVLYIIENLLRRRCLKWARIAHLDIWNTSYGHKKGRESNWQFDSRPLKVGNWFDFLACKQCATYRWKALDKGYNFASNFIAIRESTQEVMRPQSHGSPSCGNFKTLTWESQDKAIWMWPPWRVAEYTIKGKGVDFPQVRAVVCLVNPSCPWLVLAPKVL